MAREPCKAPVMFEALKIGETIQLAIGPVFLLVAVGGLLNVMTSRLGRVVDRIRALEDTAEHEEPGPERAMHLRQLAEQDRRIVRINAAITLAVIAALLVCLVVVSLFVAEFVSFDLSEVVAALFVLTMLVLIASLGCFLSEIYIASNNMRVRSEFRPSRRRKES